MGYSYLTVAQKDSYNNEFNNLHATFGRPITIYKTAQETVLVTNPLNNYLFQGAPNNSLTSTVIQSGVYLARILWGKKEVLNPFNTVQRDNASDQNMIRLSEGEARIKLDPTGAAFLAGCEKVQFDNAILDVVTDPRPHGLFDPNFVTYYLKRQN